MACGLAGIINDTPEPLPYAGGSSRVGPATAPATSAPRSVPATRAATPPTRVAGVAAASTRSLRPARGERFGTLTIPVLRRTLPIVEGTGGDELKKGVGHYSRSVMPGAADDCVLSGHRDTVFSGLGKVGIGDRLIVRTSAGEFTYEVRRVRIVHKDDRTVIVPTDHAVLTVTTCYPFHFVGSAPDRFVLVADLVGNG